MYVIRTFWTPRTAPAAVSYVACFYLILFTGVATENIYYILCIHTSKIRQFKLSKKLQFHFI
jgi:hypothetical protein